MTLLTAPAEIFPQALPLMTEVWQSWSISQGEMNREDTTTGQRRELSQQEINSLFERFPGRYRVVPSDHLK
jgi:hypothetical protein